jgi:hypothetical protein
MATLISYIFLNDLLVSGRTDGFQADTIIQLLGLV